MDQTTPTIPVAKQPLIPIDTLFDTAWEKFKNNYKKILTIVVLMFIPNFVIQLINYIATGNFESQVSFAETSAALSIAMGLLLLISIIASVLGSLTLIISIVANFELGVKEAFIKGSKRIVSYIWIGILTGFLTLLGFILFIIPGIYLAVSFSLVFIILVAEDLRGYPALTRSRNLIKGYWWAVFGRYVLLGLVFLLLYILSSILFLVPGIGSALGVLYTIILSIVFTPISLIFSNLIYRDLIRIKG